ncbi:Hypothetical protein HVR_LOCUS1089 [uncultured virus]|nr:Hypothetical protein HVR_LOCUS1089 [uncultured virus]
MEVYVLFEIFGDGDGYAILNFISVNKDLETAKKSADDRIRHVDIRNISLISNLMNKENNYTIVSRRGENILNNFCSGFGGYIIEKIKVN